MRRPSHAPQALLSVLFAVLLVATGLLPVPAPAEARSFPAPPVSAGAGPLADVEEEIGNPGDGIYIKYVISGYKVTGTNKPHDFVGELSGDTIHASGLIRVSMPGITVTQVSMDAKAAVGMTTVKQVSWPPKGDEGWVGSGQPRKVAEMPFDISVPVKPGEAGFIAIGGCMKGGVADCVNVMAAFKAPKTPTTPGATVTATVQASPKPNAASDGAELRASVDPYFLPPDGKSQSTVRFVWLENGKPVAGKNVTLGWNGDGTLDKESGVTDAKGQVWAVYTAPKLADNASQLIEIIGRGEGVAEAKALVQVGVVGILDLDVQSRADFGGEGIGLDAQIANYTSAALHNVPVEFWDGDPATGGKLLGTLTIMEIPAGGKIWACGSLAGCVNWPIGGDASKKKLTVRVPSIADFASKSNSPVAVRTYTINNYGVPFKTNVDGYNFSNYIKKAGSLEWLEDALALEIANEGLSDGVRVLSYPALVKDFAETWGAADVNGHCFGFAQSSMAYYGDANTRPLPGQTYGYTQSDARVRGNIALYHISQFTSRFRDLLSFGPKRFAPTDSLVALEDYLNRSLAERQPVGISMWGASGGHSVVAYQSTSIEEIARSLLFLYDSNKPFSTLQGGFAPKARLWSADGAFAYNDFNRIGIDPSIKLPAKAGAAFADLAKTFARQMMAEMTGGVSPMRLITFRGPGEPVLVTTDGKRLGYMNGQPVTEIPGGKIARLLDSYLFLVPSMLAVNLSARADADGTMTAGAANPTGGAASAPRGPGLALPDLGTLQAPAMASTVLFDKVPVKAGESIELQFKGDQATLVTAGKTVPPTSRTTVDPAAIGALPAVIPPTPTSAPASPAGPTASPTYRDPLDGRSDPGASGFSGPSNTNVGVTRGVAWASGKDGQAANLTGMDSFVGYAGSRLRADQGSILIRYKPAPGLADTFARRDPSWKDYGQYKPPQNGFLMDTIGWNAAPNGSWMVGLDPSAKGGVTFSIWNGGKWHSASWVFPAGWTWDTNRWYDIGVTWGPKGMTILVDGEQKAAIPDVVPINNSIPWFLGQAPWYWPYGPHALLGTYDDLRVFGEQIGPYGAAGNTGSGSTVGGATGTVAPGASGAANVTPVPGIEPLLTNPVFVGAGAVVQWNLGAPPRMLGGIAPPLDAEVGKSIDGDQAPAPGPTGGAAASAAASNGGEAGKRASGVVGSPAGVPVPTPGAGHSEASSLSGLAVGGPAAVTLGQVVGVPNGDLTGYLPGGKTGLVAGAVEKLPGGTPLFCGLPLVFGGGLFLFLLVAFGFMARPRKKRRQKQESVSAKPASAPLAAPEILPPASEHAAKGPSPARFCYQCGSRLNSRAHFCESCGAKIDAS